MSSTSTHRLIAFAAVACASTVSFAAPGGAIVGRIAFEGPAPEMPVVDGGACGAVRAEDVVVKDGGLRDVVVRLAVGAVKVKPAKLAPKVIDQRGCRYTPHVLSVTAGQAIAYRNSDPTFHNVHTVAAGGTDFNIAQPAGAAEAVHAVPTPPGDAPYRVRCDVHPWMSAFVLVTDHPFHTVSREDGTFKLENVPPGSYKLQAWHPHLGTRTLAVKVLPGQATEVRFPAFSAADVSAENTGWK
jgi:plastocyanin